MCVCVCKVLFFRALSFTAVPNFIKSSELFTECSEYSVNRVSAEASAGPTEGAAALPLSPSADPRPKSKSQSS